MKPVFDNKSSSGNGSSGSSLSWSHKIGQVGTTGLLVVGLTAEYIPNGGAGVTGVTFNSISLTKIGSISEQSSHNTFIELWALWGSTLPQNGTYTITASWGGNSNSRTAGAMSFFGVKAQTAEATATKGTNTGDYTLTAPITTLTNNALLIAIYGSQNNATTYPGSGQIEEWSQGASSENSINEGSFKVVPLAGLNQMQCSMANAEGAGLVVASFAPSPANGLFMASL